MRYQVGNKYVFASVGKKSERFYTCQYIPGDDRLTSMTLMLLECREHHRVAGEWDDEVKHDGFIFVDTFGDQWYNQYPKATYGQLDDSMDRQVIKPETLGWETLERFTDIKDLLILIYDVLKTPDDTTRRKDLVVLGGEDRKMLVEYFQSLVFGAEQLMGRRIKFGPRVVKFTDGKPDMPMPTYSVMTFEPEASV